MRNGVTDDDSILYGVFGGAENRCLTGARARWQERQIQFHQLLGEHVFEDKDVRVNWHYVYSQALMDEPNRTDYFTEPRGEGLSELADGNASFFSLLRDNSHDLKGEFTLPFSLRDEGDLTLRSGPQLTPLTRDVDVRRYNYQGIQFLPDDLRRAEPAVVFDDRFIGQGQADSRQPLQLNEVTRGSDNYTGRHITAAAYSMAEWELGEDLSLQGGLRFEFSGQQTLTFDPNNTFDPPIESNLNTADLLPAANLTWRFREKMQFRTALSRTVSRPNLRELSPADYDVVGGGYIIRGDPDLERAFVNHADARWEFYPDVGESVSIGAFYKLFQNPIEPTLRPGATTVQSFDNTGFAQNLGGEVEARKKLGFLGDAFADFYVSGNVAFIYSRVRIEDPDTILTSLVRPLVGQSPYIVNAQAGYDNEDLGLSANVLYNVFGERIFLLGINGEPDVFEKPTPLLDVVVSQRIGEFSMTFKARNLLDPQRLFTQGDQTFELITPRGREFSLGAAYKF